MPQPAGSSVELGLVCRAHRTRRSRRRGRRDRRPACARRRRACRCRRHRSARRRRAGRHARTVRVVPRRGGGRPTRASAPRPTTARRRSLARSRSCRRAGRSSGVRGVRSAWFRSNRERQLVDGVSPRRRPRSLAHSPDGSTRCADGQPFVEPRIAPPDRRRAGHVEVLGQIVAAAGIEHERVETVRAARRGPPGRRLRRSPASSRRSGS